MSIFSSLVPRPGKISKAAISWTHLSKIRSEKNFSFQRNGACSEVLEGPQNPHAKFENDLLSSVVRLRKVISHTPLKNEV